MELKKGSSNAAMIVEMESLVNSISQSMDDDRSFDLYRVHGDSMDDQVIHLLFCNDPFNISEGNRLMLRVEQALNEAQSKVWRNKRNWEKENYNLWTMPLMELGD
jgi:hypothetical protein